MKTIYMKPLALIVTIHHTTLLMESLDNKVGGNADFDYAGGKGASDPDYSEGRAKEHSVWDDGW